MAVLELKLKRVVNDGATIIADVALYARDEATTVTSQDGIVSTIYPRLFLKSGTFTGDSATDIKLQIKQKLQQFHDNLTPLQKSKVTGICAEQS